MKRHRRVLAATAAIMAVGAAPAAAETVYGVTEGDDLVTLSSSNPGQVSSPVAITGLQDNETVEGIDFRPATLQLYALGSTGRLYRVDTVTGAATQVGATALTLDGDDFDIDFNPAVDRLRIVSDADQNLRVNPNNGALAMADGTLAYAGGDANAGDDPQVTAAAYINNHPASGTYPNAPTTTLFDIDVANDALVRQDPPNAGTLVTVGSLGIDASAVAGFDVVTRPDLTERAFAVLKATPDNRSRLYSINTTTGAATAIAALPAADQIKDLAIAPPAPTFVVLTSGSPQGLATVRADRPGVVSAITPINGLQVGEKLVGIDTRPATGELYGVGSTSRVYTLDPGTGTATQVGSGAFTPALDGAAFGVDFNPAADRIRTVSDTDQNGRYTPTAPITSGAPAGDTNLAYVAGDPNAAANPNVTAGGYTNPVAAAGATTLFDLDTGLNITAEQTNPNGGVLATVGALGIDPTDTNGFDIVPRFNQGFAALQVTGETNSKLFNVNGSGSAGPPLTKANGSAALIGALGLPAGTLAEGLALLNADRIAFTTDAAEVSEGGTVRLTVVRPAGELAASVRVTSPLEGLDQTLTFGPGETTKVVSIPIPQDTTVEDDQTFAVTLSAPTGGAALGSPSVAGVTVLDDDVAPAPSPSPQPTVTPAPTTTPTATPTPGDYAQPLAVTLSAKVRPTRDRKSPLKFRTSGTITVKPGQDAGRASCTPAKVRVIVKRKGSSKTRSNKLVDVRSNCTFSSTTTFRGTKKLGAKKGTLRFTVRYSGTPTLASKSVTRTARYGR